MMITSFSWRCSMLERRALQDNRSTACLNWNDTSYASRQRRYTERLDNGRSCRRSCCITLAIGFDLQGDSATKSAERQAASLLIDAASLLLFQPVLKAKPAQAFLKVLRSLQNKSLGEVLTSYGDFSRELAASKSASWQDFLLDEVLAGRDNAWVKAVARGEEAANLDAAVEHDLDVLQRLAVGESTLASWVAESSSRVPEAWLKAASSIGPAAPEPITHTIQDTESEVTKGPCPEAKDDYIFGTQTASVSDHILGPPSSEERRQWREKIAGEWKWSLAAPHVKHYFKRHGWGLTAAHSMLHWSNGAFQAALGLLPQHHSGGVQKSMTLEAQLKARIDFHLNRGDATPLLLFHSTWQFAAENEVEWILRSLPLAALAAQGLRIVFASHKAMGEDIDDSQSLARGLAQHSRIRFLVVATGKSELTVSQQLLHHLGRRGSWPSNAMLMWVENVYQVLPENLPELFHLVPDEEGPYWANVQPENKTPHTSPYALLYDTALVAECP